jgi:hypothetical protein
MEQISQPDGPSVMPTSLEGQLREMYGRAAYTHKTHEKMADSYVRCYRLIKTVEIWLSALAAGSLLLAVFGDSRTATIIGSALTTVLLGFTLYFKEASLVLLCHKYGIMRSSSSILELDADVRLTHYRLQKIGEQTLDLASGEVVKLKPVSEAGTGAADEDEKKQLAEIVGVMNDLFSGNLTEGDMVGYVTTITEKLMESEALAEQARNNSEQQFAMGDFKDIMTDAIIDSQDGHNSIAGQLLKDERVFTAMMYALTASSLL